MNANEKRKKIICILQEEACGMCECDQGGDVDMELVKNSADAIVGIFQEDASNNLIIELSNLSEGNIRTVKRELKVLIEDYGYKKMISGCILISEGNGQ